MLYGAQDIQMQQIVYGPLATAAHTVETRSGKQGTFRKKRNLARVPKKVKQQHSNQYTPSTQGYA